jgi:hypothetical protein
MKAKKIYEILSFERGRDPKYAMGIGQVQKLAESIRNFMNKTHGVPWVDEKRTEAGLFMSVHTRSTAIITVFENVKKYIGASYFKWSDNFTAIPNVNFRIKPEFEALFSEAISIAKKMDESLSFERGKDPKESLDIGIRSAAISGIRKLLEEDVANDKTLILSIGFYDKNHVRINLDAWNPYEEDLEYIQDRLRAYGLDRFFDIGSSDFQEEHGMGIVSLIYPLTDIGKQLNLANWTFHISYNDRKFHKEYQSPENTKLKEGLSFERGKDPLQTMGIGLKALDIDYIKLGQQTIKDPPFIRHFLKSYMPKMIKFTDENPTMAPYVSFVRDRDDDNGKAEYTLYYLWYNFMRDLDNNETFRGIKYEGKYYPFRPDTKDNKIVDESLSFERGKDPIDSLDLGIRNSLRKRIIGCNVPPEKISHALTRIWENIVGNLGEKRREDVFYIGGSHGTPNLPPMPNDIKEKLFPYVFSEEAAKSSIISNNGTGSKYQLFETPYGKVLREYFISLSESYFVGFETAKALGLYKYPINESISFERGKDPKKAMDVGLSNRALEISGVYSENGERLDEKTTDTILRHMHYRAAFNHRVNYYPESGGISSHSIGFLVSDSNTYWDYILWEDKYYKIPDQYKKENTGVYYT